MRGYHLFPFELVEKSSNIIIYGAGNVGQDYIDQIEFSKYCKIVMVADKNYTHYSNLSIPASDPATINQYDYDVVIIAIEDSSIAKDIEKYLLGLNVPLAKIMLLEERFFLQAQNKTQQVTSTTDLAFNKLRIAFKPTGSLGDYIVSLRLLEELIKYVPDCEVDIYCRKALFGKVVFENHSNIKTIISASKYRQNVANYDIALDVEHVISVDNFSFKRTKRFSSELALKISKLIESYSDYYVNVITQQYRDVIFIKRCEYRGLNRYTALNCGVFEISDVQVNLPIDYSFATEFNQLKLDKYITINRGAEKVLNSDHMQTKVWSKENYEKFIKLFKENYPDIEIIQLGDSSAEQLVDVDRYFLGKNLELVKHILKNALFHFDCEGGLVHMATQLGTKCVVLFGPTSIDYYGYANNINISSGICGKCMGITSDWFINCYRGFDHPVCMQSIMPELVFDRVQNYLTNILNE